MGFLDIQQVTCQVVYVDPAQDYSRGPNGFYFGTLQFLYVDGEFRGPLHFINGLKTVHFPEKWCLDYTIDLRPGVGVVAKKHFASPMGTTLQYAGQNMSLFGDLRPNRPGVDPRNLGWNGYGNIPANSGPFKPTP